jgi:hypothetical protein
MTAAALSLSASSANDYKKNLTAATPAAATTAPFLLMSDYDVTTLSLSLYLSLSFSLSLTNSLSFSLSLFLSLSLSPSLFLSPPSCI